MYLSDETEALVKMLKQSEALSECHIIKAYPFVNKPARLKRITIAVSPSAVSAESISLGNEVLFGDYTLDADVFVPQDKGSPCTSKVIEGIVTAAAEGFPKAVSVSAITADKELYCFTAKCSFTFSAPLSFGGKK